MNAARRRCTARRPANGRWAALPLRAAILPALRLSLLLALAACDGGGSGNDGPSALDVCINSGAPGTAQLAASLGGTFNPGSSYYTADDARIADLPADATGGPGLGVGDVNNDGRADVLVSGGAITSSTNPLYVLLNDGAGSFTNGTTSTLGPSGLTLGVPGRAFIADFNGDGWNDAFIPDFGLDQPPYPGAPNTLLLNDGTGRLVDASSNILQADQNTHDAAMADIDLDGDLDLYVANIGEFEYSYTLVNDGAANFTAARLPTDADHGSTGVELADLDGDGAPDLILGGGTGSGNAIVWNDGAGNFGSAGCTPLPGAEPFVLAPEVTALDIEGDGDNDIFISFTGSNYDGQYLQVLVNQGGRTFTDESLARIPGQTGAGNWIERILPMDFNGDGAMDFYIRNHGLTPSDYRGLVWLNNGSGVFTPLDDSVFGMRGYGAFVDADADGGHDYIRFSFPPGATVVDLTLFVQNAAFTLVPP